MAIPSHSRIFVVLFVAIFTAMVGLGIIIPILPVYARSPSIGASGIWLGTIFAGFSISRSVFMPWVGRLSDRRGRKGFIAAGLLLYAVSSLGYIYAFDAVTLCCVRVMQGMCSAMIVPIAMAYIGDITPHNKEGRYMGQFNVSLYMGFACGPLIGGFLQDVWNVNAAFVAMGLLCCVACVLVLWLLPASAGGQGTTGPAPSAYRQLLAKRHIWGIVCYRFVSSFARAAVLTFLPLYAGHCLALSGMQIGVLIAAGIFVTTFLQYPCGRLADFVDRRVLVVLGSLLYAVLVLLLPWTRSFWQVLLLNIVAGIVSAMPLPAATALMVEEGKRYGMGSSMAVFNVAMSLGLGVGPLASGVVHDLFSLRAVFLCAGAVGVAGTALAMVLLRDTGPGRGAPTPDEQSLVETI